MTDIINHPAVIIIMALITVYTLYFDDLRIIFFPKSADNIFYSLSTCSFVIFILEIGVSIFAVDGYFLSFFFWLDIVSTITMIPDIGWIWLAIIGGDS